MHDDDADHGPVVKALHQRQACHGAQEQDQAPRPFVLSHVLVAGMHRLERLLLAAQAWIGHVRSSSGVTGAKWRSTSASPTAASDGGCQCGVSSLSMITDRIPS